MFSTKYQQSTKFRTDRVNHFKIKNKQYFKVCFKINVSMTLERVFTRPRTGTFESNIGIVAPAVLKPVTRFAASKDSEI